MKIYEAWTDESGTSFSTKEDIAREKAQGVLSKEAKFLYAVHADTREEAMAVHHIKMGWDPYRPVGAPGNCSKCGAIYYPEGSGECPGCGKI